MLDALEAKGQRAVAHGAVSERRQACERRPQRLDGLRMHFVVFFVRFVRLASQSLVLSPLLER